MWTDWTPLWSTQPCLYRHIYCKPIASMAVTTQTPASKTRTTGPLHAKPGRRTNRPLGDHSASRIVSLSVYPHQAQTHTRSRQRCLYASAGESEPRDSGLDSPVQQSEQSESRSGSVVSAIE